MLTHIVFAIMRLLFFPLKKEKISPLRIFKKCQAILIYLYMDILILISKVKYKNKIVIFIKDKNKIKSQIIQSSS